MKHAQGPPQPVVNRAAPTVDRRLSWMVVAFGVLVLASGVIGAMRGVVADVGAGGVLGLGLIACGLVLVFGRHAALAGVALCFLTAFAMAVRLHRTEALVPALPLGVLAVALGYALMSERRRIRRLVGHHAGDAKRLKDR
jgi:hypothetical protein